MDSPPEVVTRIEFDRNGPYVIRHIPPANLEAVDALAAAFVTKESALPIEERGPYTKHIVEVLSRLRLLTSRQPSANNQASFSSGEVKRLYKCAEDLLRQIQRSFNQIFADKPDKAMEWGFRISAAGNRAGPVLLPKTRKAVLHTLENYIKTEKSRAEAEQFVTPSLAETLQVYEDLCTQLEQRRVDLASHRSSTTGQLELAQELMDFLHAALVHLVVTRFDRKVTLDLRDWGYEVVARKGIIPLDEPASRQRIKKIEV